MFVAKWRRIAAIAATFAASIRTFLTNIVTFAAIVPASTVYGCAVVAIMSTIAMTIRPPRLPRELLELHRLPA